jgi:4-hydroxybenzoate polyprenyltransferase
MSMIFTALADVLMGYVIVSQTLTPVLPLVLLLLASAALYTAGMVLNDVFDVEQDTRERPQRPIPSGQIPLATARMVGIGLLVVGVVLAFAAGYVPPRAAAYPWRSGAVAVALASCVVIYDGLLKRTLVGPLFMGLCRFFNVLLGAALASTQVAETAQTLFFERGQLLVAAAIGVYVLGITLFARTEAKQSSQPRLIQATAVMAFGIVILLYAPSTIPQAPQFNFNEMYWPILLLVLGLSVGRHCINAISDPTPIHVQTAVKFALLSIITFDAAVAMWAAGPAYALGIFALVVPTMLLGRFISAT